MRFAITLAVLAALLMTGCGYRFGARPGAALPNVRTIAVPTFENQTFQYKIEQTLTAAVIHELLSRTSYRVQSNVAGADAVLHGTVTRISSGPIVFDPQTGRTTRVLMSVSVRVSLTDAKTGKPILDSTDLNYREPYDVSIDPATYFAENGPARERLSREVAARIVSTILQNF